MLKQRPPLPSQLNPPPKRLLQRHNSLPDKVEKIKELEECSHS
jgi:hypothetical protein